MAVIRKHRESEDVYAVDFADDMEDGETLLATPAPDVGIRFRPGLARLWLDHTDEVLDDDTGVVVDGSQVRFRLRAADADEQRRGAYDLVATVHTSTGRVLEGNGVLIVSQVGYVPPEAA